VRKLVWILAAFISLSVVNTAWAAGVAQPKSSGFFSFIRNLFHSDSDHAAAPAAKSGAESAQINGAQVPGQKRSKFIYLDDGSGTPPDHTAASVSGTSIRVRAAPLGFDKKELLTPNLLLERDTLGASGLFHGPLSPGYQNSQKTASRLSMSFTPQDRTNPLSDLDISLTSRAIVQMPDAGRQALGFNSRDGLERSAYNVGLNVGYKGFYVGGGFGKQQDPLSLAYRGYDFGLGYQGHKWSTGIQISGYKKDGDLYGEIGPDGIRVVQIGAAYSAWPWITFSGQFRYYDYNNRGSRDLLLDQSRVFTLGTSLNF
jgi:hypothetical protein